MWPTACSSARTRYLRGGGVSDQLVRLRLFQLSVLEQALHVGGILAVARAINVLLNLSVGREFWVLLVMSPILGAALCHRCISSSSSRASGIAMP